ncbi:MAG TPA: outer membrane protein assembly factor BamA [Pyrinomonadaceae bacterium]|nr:outer membrane protein assembly factor BamA [Pyrinomonadaceae bacterium]
MRTSALWRRILLAALVLSQLTLPLTGLSRAALAQGQPPQRLVEEVNVTGNRRNRKEDLLYYIQTRPGDPYNEAQVTRDFRTLMDLGFFNRTESRVLTEDGPRGGVIVTFEVKELPIIRDLQFEGLSSVPESEVLKAFRERRIGIQKENTSDPVKLNNAVRTIKELLSAKGHPNATVEVRKDEISAVSEAVTFVIKEGERVRVVEIQFEGNKHFSDGDLRGAMRYVKEAGLITRFKEQDILDREKLDVDLKLVRNYMASKGYLQARVGDPRVEGLGERRTGLPILPLPILSSTDEALRITIPVTEGRLYRLGDVKIEGNSIYSEQVIRAVIGLQKGDVASGERIYKSLFEDLKKIYGRSGFIQYSADAEPTFKDDPAKPDEGIADYVITIDEGKQFTLRRLEFAGNTFTRDNVMRREFVLNEGDIYNQEYVDYSVLRLNQLGFFDPVDKDKDIDFRQDEERAEVDVNVKVTERGRQQITFNGGISGIGGSFFGLDYSTNNLFGRGESLSFQLAAGNRQQSFVFSFTEPYVRNRPITAGFSIFAQSVKFFGEGTFLSQNADALQGIGGTQADFLNTNEANLFTQRTAGVSLFASSPLSEFYKKRPFTLSTRIGLTYSLTQTSIKDPAVNADPNSTNFIPVIYRQPNILTSRVTPTAVYDSRDMRGVDAVNGQQVTISLAFAGLGGDVRTYEPTASYQRFFPVRNKRAKIPHVFGFRLLAGHVGSFATTSKVRQAQESSLSFIGGVPVYERFFLGDEFTVRGYSPRSITPIVPLELFVTSQNVVVSSAATGPVNDATRITELQRFATLGTFTGTAGSNPRFLSRGFQPIGADTQLLGNFEYRVPLFGPLSAAAFADIGTVFNLRKGRDQIFSSVLQPDLPFLSTLGFISCAQAPLGAAAASLSSLAACADNSPLALSLTGGLVARDGRIVTRDELNEALRVGPVGPDGLPFGFQSVFLRGEAQTNTAVRLSQSAFSKFSDFRSSLGAEVRIQLPIVNVPFRLIYAYNPQARRGLNDQVPLFFQEDKSVFRFSIGRTF